MDATVVQGEKCALRHENLNGEGLWGTAIEKVFQRSNSLAELMRTEQDFNSCRVSVFSHLANSRSKGMGQEVLQ